MGEGKVSKPNRYWNNSACAFRPPLLEILRELSFVCLICHSSQDQSGWHNLILKIQISFFFFTSSPRHFQKGFPFKSCFPNWPDNHLLPLSGVIFCNVFSKHTQYSRWRLLCSHCSCVFLHNYLDNFATEISKTRVSSVMSSKVLLLGSPVTQPPSETPTAPSAGRWINKKEI